jgi:HlyD family secretion protein
MSTIQSKRGGWGKWIVILLIVAAGTGGGAWYYKRDHTDGPQYQTAPVQRGDLTQMVTATGTLNPVVEVTVGSQVSGIVSKLNVDYNSMVKSNEVIAEIDPSTYEAALGQAKANLANAKANLELQQANAERAAQLFTNKLISSADYDTAIADLHEAQASVEIQHSSVANAEANLGYCKIRSPVDGIVISRAVELGQTVASSFNTPTLFQIANDLTRMQIDASVDEADVGGVKKDQPVDFTVDAYPNSTFTGVVTQVRNAPTTVNNVVTYDCVIDVTNADYRLKPGMTANVSIITSELTNILEIPNSALRFHPSADDLAQNDGAGSGGDAGYGGQKSHGHGPRKTGEQPVFHTVYILKKSDDPDQEAKLEPVQVRIGITDNINTEVISGLKEGDEIVTGLKIPGLSSDRGTRNPFTSHHHF